MGSLRVGLAYKSQRMKYLLHTMRFSFIPIESHDPAHKSLVITYPNIKQNSCKVIRHMYMYVCSIIGIHASLGGLEAANYVLRHM